MTGYLAGSVPRAFAHRGWHIGDLAGCENTLAAFRRAVDEGYHYLETDVHATADGAVVAFHDYHLDRVTDRRGRIAELTWEQISTARIGGREPVPLLADVLRAFPDTRFNIDPKSHAAVAPLVQVLRECDALDRVGLGSFSDTRLVAIRKALGPDVPTSLGPRGVGRLLVAGAVGLPTGALGASTAQVPVRFGHLPLVTGRFVGAAHRSGLEVHVWTVNDAAEMRRLLDLGVDGLMTDRPDVLRDVLVDRGQWHG